MNLSVFSIPREKSTRGAGPQKEVDVLAHPPPGRWRWQWRCVLFRGFGQPLSRRARPASWGQLPPPLPLSFLVFGLWLLFLPICAAGFCARVPFVSSTSPASSVEVDVGRLLRSLLRCRLPSSAACSTVPSQVGGQRRHMRVMALLMLRFLLRCLSFGPPRFVPLLALLLSL